MPIAISDSSTLIHLASLGHLKLLQNFYEEVLIPPAVWREVVEQGRGRSGAQEVEAGVDLGWIKIATPVDMSLVRLLQRDLDDGESEAIALALGHENEVLLLDETEARRVARLYALRVTGVIGILLRAHREGIIALETELKKLREEAGFWISDALYAKILKAAEELNDKM